MEIDGYTLDQTCGACPEQYDVYFGGELVGYLRLRHGFFAVRVPSAEGDVIYSAHPKGDGIFEPDERAGYLHEAIRAIHAHRTGTGGEDMTVSDALDVIESLEYFSDGTIRAYPDEAQWTRACAVLRKSMFC